jgi:hypothetical protein
MSEKYTPKEEAKFMGQRAISDAKLIRGGAEFVETPQGPVLHATESQKKEERFEETKKREVIERLTGPEFRGEYERLAHLIENRAVSVESVARMHQEIEAALHRHLHFTQAIAEGGQDANLLRFSLAREKKKELVEGAEASGLSEDLLENVADAKSRVNARMDTDAMHVIHFVNEFCKKFDLDFQATQFMTSLDLQKGIQRALYARLFEVGGQRSDLVE